MSSNEDPSSPTLGQPTGRPPAGPTGWQPNPSSGQPPQDGPPQPPAQPYGQPQPYGNPQPYGQPLYPPQPAGGAHHPVWVPPVPVYPYAPWIRRVGAYLIDFAPGLVAQIPFWIGYAIFYMRLIELSATTTSAPPDDLLADLTGSALGWILVGLVLMLVAFGWQWYNRWLIGGRTGQSVGKRLLRVTLVAEVNGQPIGPVNAFLRDLLHVLDGAAYIGYLWPLWDAKRQTFSDMIMKTVVVDQRVQQPAGPPQAHQQPSYGGS